MEKIAHLALGTPNVVKTANFYKEAFGLPELVRKYEPAAGDNPPDEMVRRLYLSDGVMNLTICKVPTVGMYHIGFVVANVDETLARAGNRLTPVAPRRPRSRDTHLIPGFEVKTTGPEGVTIDLAEAGRSSWPVPPPGACSAKLQHLALGTPDLAKTANFYKEVFGLLEVRRSYERGAGDNPPDEMLNRIFLTDGYMDVAICHHTSGVRRQAASLYHFGFMVDNLDETLARLKAAGGSLISAPRPDVLVLRGPEEPRHYRALAKWRGPEGVTIDLSTGGKGR